MLQSILSAIFLYHVIKGLVRYFRHRRETPPSPSIQEQHSHAAVNAPQPAETPVGEALVWHNLAAALGNKPWMLALLRRTRTPMALRTLLLGGMYFLIGLLLAPIGLYFLGDSLLGAPEANDSALGSGIMAGIGLMALWVGAMHWREGMQALHIRPHETPITGNTPYAATKPQAAANGQKKHEDQFRQL